MGKIWRDLSQMLSRFLSLTDDNLEDKFINEQYKNWKARRLSRFLSASLLRPRRHARVLPTPCARDGLVALRCVLGR